MTTEVQVHVVTVATYKHPGLDRLVASAARFGIDKFTVLGADIDAPRPPAIKLTLLHAWLRRGLATGGMALTDLVVFVDGFDTIFRGGTAAMLAAWRACGSPQLLLAAEQGRRLVNSGAYAATAGWLAAQKMYSLKKTCSRWDL